MFVLFQMYLYFFIDVKDITFLLTQYGKQNATIWPVLDVSILIM